MSTPKKIYRPLGKDYLLPPGGTLSSVKRTKYVGKLTNWIIYDKLSPGVLEELRTKNPPDDKGRRKHKHHQLLTAETGQPHLDKQIFAVTTLLKISPSTNKRKFEAIFKRAFPESVDQLPLGLDNEED